MKWRFLSSFEMGKACVPFLVAFLLFLGGLPLLSPEVQAHNDSLFVILLTDSSTPEYKGGDVCNVEAHIFNKGGYVDPDRTPEVDICSSYYYDDYYDSYDMELLRNITLSRKEVGIYTGSFIIHDSDVDNCDSLYLHTEVSYGKHYEGDHKYNEVRTYTSISLQREEKGVNVRIADLPTYIAPGNTIHFDIEVMKDGVLASPDELDVWVYDPDYERRSGFYNKVSEGSYRAGYEVPSFIKESGDYELRVSAEFYESDYYVDDSDTEYASFHVAFLGIYYHKLVLNDGISQFEIYVSNVDGKGVGDMDIALTYALNRDWYDYYDEYYYDEYYPYEYYYGDDDYSGDLDARTDESGKAVFTIEYNESKNYDEMEISGHVKDTSTGYKQNFEFDIDLPADGNVTGDDEWPDPAYSDFDVLVRDTDIDGGEKIWCRTYFDYSIMTDQDVYTYAYSDSKVYFHGKKVSDSTAVFSLDTEGFDCDEVHVHFESATEKHPEYQCILIDSDYDGWSDDYELKMGTDPYDRYDFPADYIWTDSDRDSFSDSFENSKGTDPDDDMDHPYTYRDWDVDYFGDSFEMYVGTDPFDDNDYPCDHNDTDSDGFGDEYEIVAGTDPEDYWDQPDGTNDTDYDEHCDDEEIFYGTDPDDPTDYPHDSFSVNTDGDYYYGDYYWYPDYQYDREEIFYGTDPNDEDDFPIDDYELDSDYDGVCDLEEVFYGSDPENEYDDPSRGMKDTDGDEICDREEIFYGTDPSDDTDHPYIDPYYDYYDYRDIPDHNSMDEYYYSVCDEDVYFGDYSEFYDLDESIDFGIEKVTCGEKTEFLLRDFGDKDISGIVLLFGKIENLGQLGLDMEGASNWRCVGGYGEMGLPMEIQRVENDIVGFFVIPEFIPPTEEFSFVPYCYDENAYDDKLNYNLAVLKEGEEREPKEESKADSDSESIFGTQPRTFYIAAIIIGIVIVIVLLILFVFIIRSRRNAEEAEEDEDEDDEDDEEDEEDEDDDEDGEEDEDISERSLVWESGKPKRKCIECGATVITTDALYCAICGGRLSAGGSGRDQFHRGKSRYPGSRRSPPRDGRERPYNDFAAPRFTRPPRRSGPRWPARTA